MTGANIVHQWRITGQPDGGYPPYDFTYSSDDHRWPGDAAEICARGFLRRVTSGWEGVTFTHRTVTYSAWQAASQDGPGVTADGVAPPQDADADAIRASLDVLRSASKTLHADTRENAAADVDRAIHLYEARLSELEAGHA